MIGADLILAQVDIAKDFSLSSNAGHPDSASTTLVCACFFFFFGGKGEG